MTELENLASRIQQAQQQLQNAATARERESESLNRMWEQIRTRFDNQNAELSELRNKVVDQQIKRDQLMDAIEKLLTSIEGNIEKLSSDAITSIGSMAEEFLTSEMGNTEYIPTARAGELGGDDEGVSSTVLGGTSTPESALDENVDGPIEMGSEVGADETAKSDGDTAAHTAKENSALSGFQSLISQVEDAFTGNSDGGMGSEEEDSQQERKKRDLKDVERLRADLQKLREGISGEPN